MKHLTKSIAVAVAVLLLFTASDASVVLHHHQKRASCSDDCAFFQAIYGTCETKSIPLNSDGTSQGPDAINFTVWAQCICTQAAGSANTCSTCPQAGASESFNSKVFVAVCDTYNATNASVAGQQWQTCYRNDTCPSSNSSSSSSSSSGNSSTSDAGTLQQSNILLCLSLLFVLTTYATITHVCLL